MTTPALGIQDITFATAHHRLDLDLLAQHLGIDPAKFSVGIGQEAMSLPAEDEDVVTMGATAAARILADNDVEGLRTLIFATESGIDQSKAAGVHVAALLGLPAQIRVLETKQACYSGAGALQLALGVVARHPEEKVLVIASDVARYDLDSPGEPTQGAAAVTFLVQADPALLEVEPASGVHTADVPDFWRPNHRVTALVEGKFSISAYMDALEGAWEDYRAHGGAAFEEIDAFCYHQPFTMMAVKAHQRLRRHVGASLPKAQVVEELAPTVGYNRVVGNSYTASVFLALLALLDGDADLTGQRIGIFSYGSGAVSEFFSVRVLPGYRAHLHRAEHAAQLAAREPVDVPRYRELHPGTAVSDAEQQANPRVTAGPYRFVGIEGGVRRYEATGA